jgi:hypothetical protein
MTSPANWRETALTDEKAIIEQYFDDELRFYDADNGGEDTYYFAFSNGKFFRLDHDWSIYNHDPEWKIEHTTVITEVLYADIPLEDRNHLCQDRDYLKIENSANAKYEHRFVCLVEDDPWKGVKM